MEITKEHKEIKCKCCEEKGYETWIVFNEDSFIGTMDGKGYNLLLYNCPKCKATYSERREE